MKLHDDDVLLEMLRQYQAGVVTIAKGFLKNKVCLNRYELSNKDLRYICDNIQALNLLGKQIESRMKFLDEKWW